MEKPFKLTFSGALTARAIRVHHPVDLSGALSRIGLPHSTPVLVLVGGAGGVSQGYMNRLRPFFFRTLAPLARDLGVSVVDGGTDAGVMQLMGQAHAEVQTRSPLIGVAAAGTISLPGVTLDAGGTPLEPHHTHFVLVPGSRLGDESPWMARVAAALAEGSPSVTVLVNGGEIAWEDVSQSVRAGRQVVVVKGSGRVADSLAMALAGQETEERVGELAASGLVQAIEMSGQPGTLATIFEKILCA